MARKQVSKRTRFEIFKRDGFTCVYCGVSAADRLLQVDHVQPVSDGGTNAPTNLVTACIDCNGGKSNVPLEERRLPRRLSPAESREHAKQIRAYLEAQRDVYEAREEIVSEVRKAWEVHFPEGNYPNEVSMFRRWVGEFALCDIRRAIDIAAASRARGRHINVMRYLCGIIRNWREEGTR